MKPRWPAILYCFGLAFSACGSLHAPIAPPSFQKQDIIESAREGVEMSLRLIVDEEDYLQLFDENLPKSGIAALWVQMRNTREAPIEPHTPTWQLRINGRGCPALSVAGVFERYYERKGVRMFSVHADEVARREMERSAFSRGWIDPGQERRGFVFFRIDEESLDTNNDAALLARGIRLDAHNVITMEIPLPYAGP